VTDLLRTFRQTTVTITHAPRSFIFQKSLWKFQRRRIDFPRDRAELCDFTLLLADVITVDFKCQKRNETVQRCAISFSQHTELSDSDRTPHYLLFVWRIYIVNIYSRWPTVNICTAHDCRNPAKTAVIPCSCYSTVDYFLYCCYQYWWIKIYIERLPSTALRGIRACHGN